MLNPSCEMGKTKTLDSAFRWAFDARTQTSLAKPLHTGMPYARQFSPFSCSHPRTIICSPSSCKFHSSSPALYCSQRRKYCRFLESSVGSVSPFGVSGWQVPMGVAIQRSCKLATRHSIFLNSEVPPVPVMFFKETCPCRRDEEVGLAYSSWEFLPSSLWTSQFSQAIAPQPPP